jgi:Flp pilus assembly protein TadG
MAAHAAMARPVRPAAEQPGQRMRARRWLRLVRDRKGQSLVEFSLAAGVLFMAIIGLMNTCLAVYSYHFVSYAARAGSRYASMHGYTSSSPAAQSDVQSYVRGLIYPGIKATSLTVTTTWSVYPSGGTCTPSATCNNPGNLATVRVQYSLNLSIPKMITKQLVVSSTSAVIIWQ